MPQFVTVLGASINTLTVLIAAAVAAGLIRTAIGAESQDRALIAHALYAVVALAFGRALYVAGEWAYFGAQPERMLMLRDAPGLSLQGAALGWLIAAAVARRRRLPVPSTLIPALVLAAAALGCIPNGCLYGRELFWSDALWPMAADWPDAYLIRNPRIPVQALLAVLAFGAALLARSQAVTVPGVVALLAAGDFGLQFWRGDAATALFGVRFEQALDVAILCASAVVQSVFFPSIGAFWRKKRPG
jgi:prolipoprotein diacylglyceryltransferase